MSDTPRRRLADRGSGSPTFIGAGSRFTGELECAGDLVVVGRMHGDAVVQGALTLSAGARWEGRVRAADAVIAGEIEGIVAITEKLEIRGTARIRGAVSARTIAIAKGAIIEGDMSVMSGAPIVEFEEKRRDA